jgi:MFS family permease
VLWNLWFLGFWAVSIVAAGAGGSFSRAAATAMFTGLSGLIGFPVGGWLADRRARRGQGRRRVLLQFTLAQGLLTLVLAMYLQAGGQSAVVMAALLFFAGLFFSALQPVSQAMVADLAAPAVRGSALGVYNLIGEIGAVLSPTISGTLRDIWGSWAPAVYLDAALIFGSFVLLLFVNETARARAAVVAV